MPDWFPRNLAEVALLVPLRILFLLVAALLARTVLHRLIERAVRQALARQPSIRFRPAQVLVEATSLPAERRQQRIAALGSLARSAVTVIILVITVIMVLSELGFNVTTIVAGGSVVAVTIAFGLQNVVKDLVAGVFMLVEDQLGIGDVVDLEKATGTVEEIGLRVTRVRAEDGTVWYVRNGEVLRVGNFSQGGPGHPPKPEPTRVALVEPPESAADRVTPPATPPG